MSAIPEKEDVKDKSGFWERNGAIKAILISVLTAILTAFCTQGLSDHYWKEQFNRTNKKKLVEYKSSSLEKYATNAYKLIYLSEFAYRTKIELCLAENRLADSIYTATGVKFDTLPADYRYAIQKRVALKEPLLYKNFMEFLAFVHEYGASATIVRVQFDSSIGDRILLLSQSIVNDRGIIDSMYAEAKAKNIYVWDVDKDRIVNTATRVNGLILSLLLKDMIGEVKRGNAE